MVYSLLRKVSSYCLLQNKYPRYPQTQTASSTLILHCELHITALVQPDMMTFGGCFLHNKLREKLLTLGDVDPTSAADFGNTCLVICVLLLSVRGGTTLYFSFIFKNKLDKVM